MIGYLLLLCFLLRLIYAVATLIIEPDVDMITTKSDVAMITTESFVEMLTTESMCVVVMLTTEPGVWYCVVMLTTESDVSCCYRPTLHCSHVFIESGFCYSSR